MASKGLKCGGDAWVPLAALELCLRCLRQRLDSEVEELAYDRARLEGATQSEL